jgi:crotonobetainyl-CoA:carnitine CoA-transferase CaiB-like acyl-CoA transferase
LTIPVTPLLQGYRFVEAADAAAPVVLHLATAFAGRVAADLGAEVLRVVPAPDPIPPLESDTREELVDGRGVLHRFLNRGKITIGSLAAALPVDVLLAGSPDMARVAEAIAGARRPLVVHVAAFPGDAGMDGLPVSELGLQALSGIADLFGEPAGSPLALAGHQAAFATGYAAFAAAIALVAGRVLHGSVDRAEVDALGALAWVNWKAGANGAMSAPITREGARAEWPVMACADGHFALVFMERDWPTLRDMIGDIRLLEARFDTHKGRVQNRDAYQAIIATWMRRQTKAELFAAFRAKGIPGAPVLTPADQLADPLLAHRGIIATIAHGAANIGVPVSPCRVRLTEAPRHQSPREIRGDGGLPLAGVRVLDLGIITAGAGTSALLADLGAEVLKIETSAYPDPFRAWAGIEAGDSPLFKFNNRNKRGVDLDLKTASGRAAFLELATRSDIVLENFRRGVLDRLGLGFDALRDANPNLVLASISGQGQSGPGSDHVTYGSTLEALSGFASMTGYRDGAPLISGRNLNYPDQVVCLFAAASIVATLLHVRRRGGAAHLDIAQRDVALCTLGDRIAVASLLAPPTSWLQGNGAPDQLLQEIYTTRDRKWLAVSVATAAEAEALRALLRGSADDAALARWIAERDVEIAAEALRAIGISAYPALDGAAMFQHPAVQKGATFARSPSGKLVKGFPFQFVEHPMSIYADSPAIGEHTAEVLSSLRRREPA